MSLVGHRASNHPAQVAKRGTDEEADDRKAPIELFQPLWERYRFTIDAAASQANAQLPRFWTKADDALAKSWAEERVWCNPPYSEMDRWVQKAWHAMVFERAVLVVMLVPANRTEQVWWQRYVEEWRDGEGELAGVRLSVRFLAGRIRFERPEGYKPPVKGDRPAFASALLIWEKVEV